MFVRRERGVSRERWRNVFIVFLLLAAGSRAVRVIMNKFDSPRAEPIVLSSECIEVNEHVIALQLPDGTPEAIQAARAELFKGCAGLTRSAYHCYLRAKSTADLRACSAGK